MISVDFFINSAYFFIDTCFVKVYNGIFDGFGAFDGFPLGRGEISQFVGVFRGGIFAGKVIAA